MCINDQIVCYSCPQDSWEDEEEKKDEEKSETKTLVPTKTKPNKALKAKLSEQEVSYIRFSRP